MSLEETIDALKRRVERNRHTRNAVFTSLEQEEQSAPENGSTHSAKQEQNTADGQGDLAGKRQRRKPYLPNATIREKVCKVYDAAAGRGEKLTYEQIAAQTGYSITTVHRVLKAEMRRSFFAHPEAMEEMMRRGFDTRFSTNDLKYFTGISKEIIRDYFAKLRSQGARRPQGRRFIKMFGPTEEHPRLLLSYKLASQIYKAEDNALPINCHKLLREYALAHRRRDEEIIKEDLRTLCSKELQTPYLP